jgi:hypothetical protein
VAPLQFYGNSRCHVRCFGLLSIQNNLLCPAKYQGVTITDKVNWSQHIDSITNKANRTLGFLCRNLKISTISIKERACKTLVHLFVEYASPVWDLIIRQTSGSWSVHNGVPLVDDGEDCTFCWMEQYKGQTERGQKEKQ